MVRGNEKIDPGQAWAAHAPELARWVQKRMVNRLDACGGYHPASEIGRTFTRQDGATGTLQPTTTRKVEPTLWRLERHFRDPRREHLVGLHTTSLNSTSLWGDIDIDHHGDDSPDPVTNERAALAWYGRLVEMGFHPLLWDSNGKGGYHLDVLMAEPAPTPRVYHFLRQLVADYARHGLTAPPETFPKQARLAVRPDGSGAFGNWCRVFGKHHSCEHWARVWDGHRWLAGEDAVLFVLGLTGDPVSLLPDPPPEPASVFPGVTGSTHELVGQERLAARIRGYVRHLPNLAEGQGRDDIAFQLAAFLVKDLALADAEALPWLEMWDAGNRPPKGQDRLAEILNSARRYGQRPVGCGLWRTQPPRQAQLPRRNPHCTVLSFALEID